jgi:branched-chain amino acid transport system substrate-binding protein
MKTKIFLLGVVILLALILFAYRDDLRMYGQSIHIAFAGPMSGEGEAAGRLMTRSIQLYFDKINQRGGINGKKLILDKFNDENNTKVAREQAQKIFEENKAVAVIGHWYSAASISAGEIYKKHQIPAITPGSVKKEVTEGNKWYFRNIYNASASGQFLAYYVKKVFKINQVTIIHDNSGYGSYLASVFEQAARSLGMTISNQWDFQPNDKNKKVKLKGFVEQLKQDGKTAGAILLATQASEGIELVKYIKDAGLKNYIISGSGFSEQTFVDGFNKFPTEKTNPGYYTNDIYVATPLIFDTANEKAQNFKEEYQAQYYPEKPDWSAAYAYDTAMVLVEAIKRANIEGTQESISSDRKKIRDALASFTKIDEAVEGPTGFNYFDENRDAQKPVVIGVYKHKNLVSALTQLQVVRNSNEITDLEQAIFDERVLLVNDKHMYKTNVVYVGLKIIGISDIDIKNLQFTLDFKLWFRFQGDFDIADLEFVNVIDHKPLKKQLETPIEEKPKKKDKETITYHVYRIKGRFRADFLPNYFAYKQHVVGVSFRHRVLTRNNLIYVTDVLGMGHNQETSLVKRLAKNHVLNPASGWSINRVWFFSKIMKESSAGDPDYLNVSEGLIEYSQFNAAIQIQKDQFTLQGLIPDHFANHMMVVSGILFLLLTFFVKSKQIFFKFVIWLFQVIFAAFWLLSGELLFADWLADKTSTYQMKYIIKVFDILWWLIPAFLINVASERFIWTPLEERLGAIPNIIRHFFALLVYFIAIIGITVFVYEQQFTSLLAASGMIAMVIGLAIQINISNVFSGIMINMERPFRIGDWVKIGKSDEGKVIDINWRATRIKGRDGCILSLPNSIAAESVIVNYYYPDEVYWLWPIVYVPPRHPPARVKKILLNALLSASKILKEPAPIVFFKEINEWAASYWIAFCADDYAGKYFILEEVWTQVWFHLSTAGITPAIMRQEFHVFKGEKGMDSYSTKGANPIGQEEDILDIFGSSPFEMKALASKNTFVS